MITFHITTEVKDDRRVVLTLPPEAPTGQVELVVTVDSYDRERENTRAAALDQFMALARSSAFRSTEPYPSRDDLHERH